MNIQISHIIRRTKVEGPGTRFCIYTQGCDIHCKGCANTEMWDPCGGIRYSVDKIKGMISQERQYIDGITFLGGEPTYQSEAVLSISEYAHSLGLSVLLFSGHTYDELQNIDNAAVKSLLNETDLLIAGPFIEELFDLSRPWVGSSNQTYHFLSERMLEWEQKLPMVKNAFEISLSTDGFIRINGMGNLSELKKVLNEGKQMLL